MSILDRLFLRARKPAVLIPAWPWASQRCTCGRCVNAAGDPIILCLRCYQEWHACRCRAKARA